MQWIKNMKISVRLFFFSALILFLVATGVVSLVSIRKVHEHLKEIYMVRMPGIDWLIESDRDLQQLLVSERSIMFTDSSSPCSRIFDRSCHKYETVPGKMGKVQKSQKN